MSSDVIGASASCIFDAPLTLASCVFDAPLSVAIGDMVNVLGWYDNEWGYANRLVDLVTIIGGVRG